MTKYKFTAIRNFSQHYEINIKAKTEEEAWSKAHDLKYNNNHEWTEVGYLAADDKLIDIEHINSKGQVVFKEPTIRRLIINE